MKNILKTLCLSTALFVSANAASDNPDLAELAQSSVHAPAIGTNEMPPHFLDAGVTQQSFDTFIEKLYALRDEKRDCTFVSETDEPDDNAKLWLPFYSRTWNTNIVTNETFMDSIKSLITKDLSTKNISYVVGHLNRLYNVSPDKFVINTEFMKKDIERHRDYLTCDENTYVHEIFTECLTFLIDNAVY